MSRAKVKRVDYAEIKSLLEALSLSRSELATLCGAQPSTIGWWFKKEQIPIPRLSSLAREFAKKIRNKPELTIEETRIKQMFERTLERPFSDILEGIDLYPKVYPRLGLADNVDDTDRSEILSKLTLEELIDEIQRRGWQVSLNRGAK